MAEEHAQETSDTSERIRLSVEEPVEDRTRGFSLKCIKDKWIPITATVVITALIITIIALAAKKTAPCPSYPPHINAGCPDDWVGYQGKCYYFSETESNWSTSQSHCSSHNASLALIDSWKELNFTQRHKGVFYHWIGLRREQDQPWKWSNGTIFNNLFPVQGVGQCAFLNSDNVGSSRCFSERRFICNQPDKCPRGKLRTTGGDTMSQIT